MSEYKMSVRQICFTIIAFFTSTKMIFLAAVTSEYAGKSLWISALINFFADGIIIYIILLIGERFPNKTFFEIIRDSFGNFVAKTVYFILAVVLLFKSYVPIMEQRNFIEISLYETLPTILTFLPFFLFSAYFSYKGLKAVARCSDIMIWFIIIAVFGLIALTIPNTDFSELLPIFKGTPIKDILGGSIKSSLWYFDSIYFLFFIGNYKRERLSKTKIMSAFFTSAAVIILYLVAIYAEFGVLTERQYFVPAKMGLFSVALLNIGRIDYIASIFLSIVNVFAIALPLLFSTYCLEQVFNFKNKAVPTIITNSIMFTGVFLSRDYFFDIFGIFQNLSVFLLGFTSFIIPFAAFVFCRKRRTQ